MVCANITYMHMYVQFCNLNHCLKQNTIIRSHVIVIFHVKILGFNQILTETSIFLLHYLFGNIKHDKETVAPELWNFSYIIIGLIYMCISNLVGVICLFQKLWTIQTHTSLNFYVEIMYFCQNSLFPPNIHAFSSEYIITNQL